MIRIAAKRSITMIFQTHLRAFHNDPAVKEKYLARVRAHAAADEIVHGIYWKNGKGCAVGCTVHSASHIAYETELGIPRILAKLEDNIFESLANGRSKLWPEQFLEAPKVGSDLSFVWPHFAVWLLTDPEFGMIQFNKSKNGTKAIQDVADAYQKVVDGNAKNIDWSKLRYAAYSAAYAAAAHSDYAAAIATAYAADYAAAAAHAAAASYADYAAAAASYAAYAAASADAADAATATADRNKFRNAQADKLLELMRAAQYRKSKGKARRSAIAQKVRRVKSE